MTCDVISHFISRSVWLLSTQRPCVVGATIRVRAKKDMTMTVSYVSKTEVVNISVRMV